MLFADAVLPPLDSSPCRKKHSRVRYESTLELLGCLQIRIERGECDLNIF